MNKLYQIIATALLVSIALFVPQAGAVTQTVDCDRGQTIQSALDKKQRSSEELVINVSGICEENVNIQRDGVTINGNNNATVVGTIHVHESDRITLWNIIVTGQGQGIAGFGSSITLNNVAVTENQGVGIQVYGSKVALHNTTVTANHGFTGIQAGHGSTFNTYESNISNNNGPGLYIDLNSMLEMSYNTVVNGNSGPGVQLVLTSSALIWNGSSIKGNEHGVYADNHSFVDVANADVSNNHINGIFLIQDSGARTQTGTTISGNAVASIQCNDTESSFVNYGGLISDPINCTDFNQ